MQSGRSGNSGILDDDTGTRSGLDAHVHTKWQRPAWATRVSGGKSKQHRPGKTSSETRDGFSRGHGAARLIAPAHLSEDQRTGTAQHAAEPKLRQHAVDAVRPLVDVLEKQDTALRRVERERRAERGNQLSDSPAKERPLNLARAKHFETLGRELDAGSVTGQREKRALVITSRAARESSFDHGSVQRR